MVRQLPTLQSVNIAPAITAFRAGEQDVAKERERQEKEQQRQDLLSIGQAAASGDLGAAERAAFQTGRVAEGLQLRGRRRTEARAGRAEARATRAEARQAKAAEIAEAERNVQAVAGAIINADTPEKFNTTLARIEQTRGLEEGSLTGTFRFENRLSIIDEALGAKAAIVRSSAAAQEARQAELFPITKQIKQAELAAKKLEASGGSTGQFKTAQDRVKFEQSLRKEHTSVSGDFRERANSFQLIETNARDGSSAAGVALVFNFMKMLDPTSVVRDSEQETLKKARGVFERMGLTRSAAEAAIRGNPLTEKQRNDILQVATNIFSGVKKAQSAIDDRFRRIAENAGISPDVVILPLGQAFTPQAPPAGAPGAPSPPIAGAPGVAQGRTSTGINFSARR